MRVDTGGAVFGIRKVEYGTPFEECFLEMTPMGYSCRFEKGEVRKSPAVWPTVTSFSLYLSTINGLV